MLTRILILSLASVPILIIYMTKRRYKKMLEQLDQERNFYHQLISIDMKNFGCRTHLLENKECNEWCSLSYQRTLQKFVSSANSSICICMYMLTLKSINYEIIRAHKRGVNVRVITDKGMLQTKPVQENISRLKENGIPYKIQPVQQSMMHHKFCLIDKENKEFAKMFFGSLNLTSQGLCSNFDNVILTNNLNIIGGFSEEFEELWNLF